MSSSFHERIARIDHDALGRAVRAVTTDDVDASLGRERPDEADALALFSPAAFERIEEMARRAAAITERRFGRVIQLYAPMYLSNECANICTYCGFSNDVSIPRVSLSTDQAVREAMHLHEQGFRHILLVTGEYKGRYGADDIERVVAALKGRFASIAIEVFPMSEGRYRTLERAGVDGLTLYQETYHPDVYARLHPKGPKSRYDERLHAIERGGEAGFRSLGVGALLGLADWRAEAVLLAWHARFLTKRVWRSRIAVSFPRVNPAENGFAPEHPVSDADLVQMILAMRLLLPDAELVLSTREGAELRDRLIGLGITRMSAGSRTNPGGYVTNDASGRQFEVSDERSPGEVAEAIAARGFEPVWKDFDPAFVQDAR